jgi:hypothetical protein
MSRQKSLSEQILEAAAAGLISKRKRRRPYGLKQWMREWADEHRAATARADAWTAEEIEQLAAALKTPPDEALS